MFARLAFLPIALAVFALQADGFLVRPSIKWVDVLPSRFDQVQQVIADATQQNVLKLGWAMEMDNVGATDYKSLYWIQDAQGNVEVCVVVVANVMVSGGAIVPATVDGPKCVDDGFDASPRSKAAAKKTRA